MEYQSFFNGDFFKQISLPLLYHYFFIIIENKSNENQNKCSNSIKMKLIIPLTFHQIDFDWALEALC